MKSQRKAEEVVQLKGRLSAESAVTFSQSRPLSSVWTSRQDQQFLWFFLYEKTCTKAPKKQCHYVDSSDFDSDVNVLPKSTKKKKTCNVVFAGIGQRVEVIYYDEVWYKEILVNFSGQWKVEFDDDDEEAFISR
jgi:hypothetical protein